MPNCEYDERIARYFHAGYTDAMNPTTQAHLQNIHALDKNIQGEAYHSLLEATNQPVDWAYDAWDELVCDLMNPDNRLRSIAAQLLCNLAKSEPENRILKDFDALLNVTCDGKFVTARHALQSLWKIGAVGPKHRQKLLTGLATRFNDCASEKNCTLIRYEIIVAHKSLHDAAPHESIRTQALALIATEPDIKYRKKYADVWKSWLQFFDQGSSGAASSRNQIFRHEDTKPTKKRE